MNSVRFLSLLPAQFYTGVPDSLLSAFSAAIMNTYGLGRRHIIAANEGNAVGLAAGYHLATGKIPCVYLQNSGVGNIINPVTSLLSDKVYGIPCLFVVGWRGEPGVHDEPQHAFMGGATAALLEDAGVQTAVLSKETTEAEIKAQLDAWTPLLREGKSVAFLVKKGALDGEAFKPRQRKATLTREEAILEIINQSGSSPIVCTTGKASRELFELRKRRGEGHEYDFLTVGSMGHCSSIALGIALEKPEKTVWCIDGDGAALMHLGAMAIIGTSKCQNLIHVVINNGAHESVGGQPTAADRIDLPAIARACGYGFAASALDAADLARLLENIAMETGPIFLEIKCRVGAREDLGRPTGSPAENMRDFMQALNGD